MQMRFEGLQPENAQSIAGKRTSARRANEPRRVAAPHGVLLRWHMAGARGRVCCTEMLRGTNHLGVALLSGPSAGQIGQRTSGGPVVGSRRALAPTVSTPADPPIYRLSRKKFSGAQIASRD